MSTSHMPKNPIVNWYAAMEAAIGDRRGVADQKRLADASGISASYISGCERPADHRAPRVPELANRRKLHRAAVAIEKKLAKDGRLPSAPGGIPPEGWDAFKAALPNRRAEAGLARRKKQPTSVAA